MFKFTLGRRTFEVFERRKKNLKLERNFLGIESKI